jgi:hypothetical protein
VKLRPSQPAGALRNLAKIPLTFKLNQEKINFCKFVYRLIWAAKNRSEHLLYAKFTYGYGQHVLFC